MLKLLFLIVPRHLPPTLPTPRRFQLPAPASAAGTPPPPLLMQEIPYDMDSPDDIHMNDRIEFELLTTAGRLAVYDPESGDTYKNLYANPKGLHPLGVTLHVEGRASEGTETYRNTLHRTVSIKEVYAQVVADKARTSAYARIANGLVETVMETGEPSHE